MNFWCRLGLHKWTTISSQIRGMSVLTLECCARKDCKAARFRMPLGGNMITQDVQPDDESAWELIKEFRKFY